MGCDLTRIDWVNHDGVNRAMINDFVRNQFYDRVLEQVRGFDCIDIGFGTGLLSMIALKHGARHITAFESDPDRYQLGCLVIEDLGLGDRISLHQARYRHDTENDLGIPRFNETVNGNLWQEGLWQSLPRTPGTKFLPATYGLEFYVTVVPDRFAAGIMQQSRDLNCFDPGIDLGQEFLDSVNRWMAESLGVSVSSPDYEPLCTGLNQFEHQIDTTWGWIPYMRCFNPRSGPRDWYRLDTENCMIHGSNGQRPIDFDARNHSMILDIPEAQDHAVLVVPRAVLQHGDHSLYLDMGHWGPCQRPCIVNRARGQLHVTHDFVTGDIDYQLI